ncbi:MAG: caspase family protein [Spirochaetota bacterium]|nr:caspase family protein [Spirochaetota bacterium]
MLRITVYGAALLLLLTACTINPTPPDRYALVYGVSEYVTQDDLTYTKNDATEVANELISKGYNVYLRITDDLGNNNATKVQFIDDFQNIVPTISKDDILLVYFSGHGGQIVQGADSDEDQFADGYDEAILFSNGIDTDSLLTDNELYTMLSQSDVVKKVVIIDACNSGGFIGQEYDYDALNPDYTTEDKTSDGIISSTLKAFFSPKSGDIPPSTAIVISAAGEQESSLEAPDGYSPYHGYFTFALLKALSYADYNRDGYIDTGEIYKYTFDYMYLFNIYDFSSSLEYMPHISGGPVDYILFEAD